MQNIVKTDTTFSKLCYEYVETKKKKARLKRRLRRLRGEKREPVLEELRKVNIELYKAVVRIEMHPTFKALLLEYPIHTIWRTVIPQIAKEYAKEVKKNE